VVAALSSGSAAAAALAAAYADERELSDPELARLAHLVDAAGGRDWCANQAADLMNAALECTGDADLIALATYIVNRDR
jgi:geranylgeranyl diphosphate synthase type I